MRDDVSDPCASSVPAEAPQSSGSWRVIKAAIIFVIVAWHLVFLLIRNPLDLWKDPITDWLKQKSWWELSASALKPSGDVSKVGACWDRWGETYRFADRVTNRFANVSGCEQGWVMFSPPMAKRAPFLGVRFEFANSPPVTVESDTHPNPAQFIRIGGWQVRKYEDRLMEYENIIGTHGESHIEFPMWAAFVRMKARLWREQYRYRYVGYEVEEPIRMVLVKLYIDFPRPGQTPGDYRAPEERDVAAFTPDGRPSK